MILQLMRKTSKALANHCTSLKDMHVGFSFKIRVPKTSPSILRDCFSLKVF